MTVPDRKVEIDAAAAEEDEPEVRICRECGCTGDQACAETCTWIAASDVCSHCASSDEEPE